MTQHDGDLPPAKAIPLREAVAKFGDPKLLEEVELSGAGSSAQEMRPGRAIVADVVAQLRSGRLIAWGRETTIGGRWCSIQTPLWKRLLIWDLEVGMVGQFSWSPQCPIVNVFYDVRVAPWAVMLTRGMRRCSVASLKKVLRQVEAEKGAPLTLREAEAIGNEHGASRQVARDAWRAMVPDELRRPGAKPRNTRPKRWRPR